MLHNIKGRSQFENKGHIVVYYPEHPAAWRGSGLVYLHRLLMENKLNRLLKNKECVHHRDGNPKNNKLRNLKLMYRQDHNTLHANQRRIKKRISCLTCGKMFQQKGKRMKHCSPICASIGHRKVVRPTKIRLNKLVWQKSIHQLAKEFGVSDTAITKWCKQYNIKKPGRGYWAKKYSRQRA